jgi:ABC-type dipeptide/oligopeptide/nickel transport system permease subunit
MAVTEGPAAAVEAQFASRAIRSWWLDTLRLLVRRHKFEFFGSGFILLTIVLLAVLADVIQPAHENFQDARAVRVSPNWDHPFGTDNFGRDIFSRVTHGARISLTVGLASVAIGITIATLVGAISGYAGGWIDTIIQRVIDTLMAFPSLVLILLIVAMFGNSQRNVILAISIFIIAAPSRVVRAEVLSVKQRQFVDAARATGASNIRILTRHIFPNILHAVIVIASINVAGAILVEASLSFLGLGIPAPAPSWGNMISGQRAFLESAPWMVVAPGIALSLTVYAFNMMGDAIRDVLDPHLRE